MAKGCFKLNSRNLFKNDMDQRLDNLRKIGELNPIEQRY